MMASAFESRDDQRREAYTDDRMQNRADKDAGRDKLLNRMAKLYLNGSFHKWDGDGSDSVSHTDTQRVIIGMCKEILLAKSLDMCSFRVYG